MPRRIYTYMPDGGWEIWNLITTLGVPLQAIAILIFVVNVIVSLRKGEPAGPDPWDGPSSGRQPRRPRPTTSRWCR